MGGTLERDPSGIAHRALCDRIMLELLHVYGRMGEEELGRQGLADAVKRARHDGLIPSGVWGKGRCELTDRGREAVVYLHRAGDWPSSEELALLQATRRGELTSEFFSSSVPAHGRLLRIGVFEPCHKGELSRLVLTEEGEEEMRRLFPDESWGPRPAPCKHLDRESGESP